VCTDPQYPLCIVMEYMSHGTLYAYLRTPQGQKLTTEEMTSLAKGIAAGLTFVAFECDLTIFRNDSFAYGGFAVQYT
jgi:serine/threonine protein kinase